MLVWITSPGVLQERGEKKDIDSINAFDFHFQQSRFVANWSYASNYNFKEILNCNISPNHSNPDSKTCSQKSNTNNNSKLLHGILTRNPDRKVVYWVYLTLACEPQTYFRSWLLSLRKILQVSPQNNDLKYFNVPRKNKAEQMHTAP